MATHLSHDTDETTVCGIPTRFLVTVGGFRTETTTTGERVETALYGPGLDTCRACIALVSTYSVSRDGHGAVTLWRATPADVWGPTPVLVKHDTDPAVWDAACRTLL